ncbi:MAG: hypothetical protein IPI35_27330 [Deltaproteobacteria bacterium]|nr:hypothetical protein [Deltaproteobacteria bacterium]
MDDRYVRDRRLDKKKALPRLWGAEGDDGRSQLTRAQVGLRGGASYEPWTKGGALVVLSADGWAAWSRWRRHSPWAPYTPYQPNGLIGPYLRYQYSVPWTAPPSLTHSTSIIVTRSCLACGCSRDLTPPDSRRRRLSEPLSSRRERHP